MDYPHNLDFTDIQMNVGESNCQLLNPGIIQGVMLKPTPTWS